MVRTLRQNRGYFFEDYIVKYFNDFKDWHARRLGGSSIGLPDIVATNNEKNIIIVIEAKSTSSNKAYVPAKEIQRCLDTIKMFDIYENQYLILAFKFKGVKGKRTLQYHFFTYGIDNIKNLKYIECDYKGQLNSIVHNKLEKTFTSFYKLSEGLDSINEF